MTAWVRRVAASRVGSVSSGRARSSAASVWSNHRYRRSNWESSSAGSRSAAGTVMPSSRSESRPSRLREAVPVAQAAHLHARRVDALQGGGAQLLDGAVLLVRLVQAPDAEQGGMPDGAYLGERGG